MVGHRRGISTFWGHYSRMASVMGAGMVAGGAGLVLTTGAKSWEEVTIKYPNQALLVIAATMTIPMVAYMLYEGMGRKNSIEMAAVMVLPVIPFLGLVWFDVTKSAQCGVYCILTFMTMYALMRYRRDEYIKHDSSTS